MKLWIDDIRNAPTDEWTVARTVNQAIRALSKFDFEEISIDHDISHQVVVGKLSRPYPCDECFCAVAYYLAEKYWTTHPMNNPELELMRPLAGPKIILHSSNPVGAQEQFNILKDYGVKSEIKSVGRAANRLEMEI
jgi:hypothetical protein